MASKSQPLVVITVLAAVAVGVFAYMSTRESAAPAVTPVVQPVVASAEPSTAPVVTPSAVESGQNILPSNILLVGTTVDVGKQSAIFLVDADLITVRLGDTVAGSVEVIQTINTDSVWMGPKDGKPVHEIKISPPKLVAERRNEAQQAAIGPSYGANKPLPDSQTVVLKDENGNVPPPEQQVRVRKRVPQQAGPVGAAQ